MPPTTRHSHRRPAQRPSRAADSSPSSLDRQRWMDNRAGMSVEELAARENVRLVTIQASIDKMKLHAARNSQESVEMATREIYIDSLPSALQVFERALHAKKMDTQTITNPDTQKDEVILVEVDDLAMQLKAVEQLKSLLAGVTPRTPMVQVDARTQINNPSHPSQQGALSSESIIRQIRMERGLALTAGDIKPKLLEETPAEVDIELQSEMEEEAELADPDSPAEIEEAEYVDGE